MASGGPGQRQPCPCVSIRTCPYLNRNAATKADSAEKCKSSQPACPSEAYSRIPGRIEERVCRKKNVLIACTSARRMHCVHNGMWATALLKVTSGHAFLRISMTRRCLYNAMICARCHCASFYFLVQAMSLKRLLLERPSRVENLPTRNPSLRCNAAKQADSYASSLSRYASHSPLTAHQLSCSIVAKSGG